MRFRVCAIGVAALFFSVTAFAAGNDPATAREQLKIGYQLKEAGKCDEAIPHLAESLRLDARATGDIRADHAQTFALKR